MARSVGMEGPNPSNCSEDEQYDSTLYAHEWFHLIDLVTF